MKKINVLIVGSDSSVKGGITTVINQYLNKKFGNVKMDHLPTYIEGNNIIKILFFLKSYFKYIKKIISNEFDIVHIHMSYKGSFYRKLLIVLVSKLFNKKIVIHLHGSEFKVFYYSSNKLIKKFIKFLIRSSDAFLVLGDNWEKVIKEIEPDSKTFVLRNSISIPDSKVNLNEEEFNILFLGVLIKRKGIYDLIDAIKLLDDKDYIKKYNMKFIIGGIGKEQDKLEEIIKNKKLGYCINMAGWVDGLKKEELLKKSQLFVLPSYNEGLPMAILEAMSHGIPTISTKVGSIDEVVKSEENGYLIKPRDIDSLANSILDMAKDKEKWKKFSENSRNIIIKEFDEKNYFNYIEKVYFEILKN